VHWFSYRRANRERPIVGDRRTPSPLGDIQPDHWLPEYTSELINVLNVLGLLVELEPAQAQLLDKICSGPLISEEELRDGGALGLPLPPRRRVTKASRASIIGIPPIAERVRHRSGCEAAGLHRVSLTAYEMFCGCTLAVPHPFGDSA
jgi:hypothetical protein